MTIDQILEAAEKATPGLWYVDRDERNHPYIENCYEERISNILVNPALIGEIEANANLISGAPQLAAEVKRLRALNDELDAECTKRQLRIYELWGFGTPLFVELVPPSHGVTCRNRIRRRRNETL